MNIQRFTAPTSREALAKARMAFGDSTLILSNRPTENGVEVVATAEDTLAALDKPSERYVQQALAAMALALKDPKRPRSVIVAHWDAMQGVDWDDVLELRN